MSLLVMKFGGSLMSNAHQLRHVIQIIHAESLAWKRLVVVVSAMSSVTDALRRIVELAHQRELSAARRLLTGLRADHLALIESLFPAGGARDYLLHMLDQQLFKLLALCDGLAQSGTLLPSHRSEAMAIGERLMASLVATLAQQEGLRVALVQAESVIITDDVHQNAHPLRNIVDERAERILRPLLDNGIVPILAGFIGATRTGETTTLGRGGSDLTATLLAAALGADEVWMWTSVDGIMSADPALVPNARVIPSLTYEEIGELAFFGARLLHPGAIEPLIRPKIPLRVRNPHNLDHDGTLVHAYSQPDGRRAKAVTAVDGLYLALRDQPFDLVTFLAKVREKVPSLAADPVIVMQSYRRATLVFVVPTSEGPQAVQEAMRQLQALLPDWEVQTVKVVAVIGANADLRLMLDNDIRPLASAFGANERRLIAVQPTDVRAALRQLHRLTESDAFSR
ncbi:MAG: aspartate kinase [Anaerolineae bacterium]|nr:aspartate kinase [Anaerolineae bacterium]